MICMNDRIFTLDTNILIYAIDHDAKEKHKIASNLIDTAMDTGCVLTLQVLSEFYAATTRKNYLSHQESTEIVMNFMKIFPIIPATAHSLEKALHAKQKYNLQFWDSLLWATAKEGHCKLIVSEDFQHQQVIDGVKIFNPFIDEDFPDF